MAEFHVITESTTRKSAIGDIEKCIFCGEKFTSSKKASCPDLLRMDSLFEACSKREDNISLEILRNKDMILSGHIEIRYHRNCRATFASTHHLTRMEKKKRKDSDADEVIDESVQDQFLKTRAHFISSSTFSWKKNCFICGKGCHEKRNLEWSMVESAIDSSSPNIYTRVLNAAIERQDNEIQLRLRGIPNGDLVAVEARYHRKPGCLATYLNARNIGATKTRSTHTTTDTVEIQSLTELISEIKTDIELGGVFILSNLRKKYLSILERNEVTVESFQKYDTRFLKKEMAKMLPELAFISRPGKSCLVCSNSITVRDAIRKIQDMSSKTNQSEESDDSSNFTRRNQTRRG